MQESIRFASSGDDIKIWDSSSITVVEQFNPHTSHSVNSLCWGNNNNFLVTASTIGDKIVVSSCKGKPVPLFELAEGAKQTCVSLNSSSVHIVSGGLDNTVKIWDLKSRRLHRCLKDHKDEVTCVTFNWNDCYIASGSMSGEIILHNVTTNLSSTPFGHGSSQVGLDTHGVKLIPVRRSSAKPMHHLKDPAVDSPFCRLTEIGKTGRFPWGNSPLMAHLKNYLWQLFMDCVVIKTITVKTTGNLDLRTSYKELENFHLGYTVQVLFSIGAKLISLYCSCYLFRESWTTALQTVQYLKDFSCNKAIMACQNLKVIPETRYISLALSHSKPIRHLKYSSFKKSLLGSVSDSGTVTLWDVNSQNPYHNFENAHKAPASEICFSPVNELLLVTIGLDKRIILYDTSSKKLLRTLVAESPLTAVDFMPDGTTLAIGSSRGKIYHYDLRKLTSPVKTVSAHKTSVKCIRLQYSSTCSKSSFNKCSSNKPASKRTDVKASSNVGGIQNTGIIKNLTSNKPITVSPQPMSTIESKGADVVQDKTGFPRCGSMNVILSKETDHGKSANMTNFDDLGRDSLGDMFSPVRDDVAVYKTNEDLPGKGDGLDFQPYFPGLDFLPQFNTVFPIKRNTVGACMQGTHSSPLHAFVGSPIKEEDEHPNQDAEATKINIGKQESREPLKQLSKLSSLNAESGNSNTPPLPTVIKTPEANERLGKNIQALLMSDSPVNGTTLATPKITSSVTAGVASSLSEKIVDTIGSNRPNAPLTSVQIHFIQNMIQETLDDFREACHRDIVNLQVEMIKQFHMQLNEMHALLGRYSVNESLVAEIERLREENKRLRTHF